ncbi:MAG: hypothetical protein GF355_11625 [Candidatus Eisenbacteria bacterium]|nr:hypothetical protein [Candidatus Eisenbacteria bacterium]
MRRTMAWVYDLLATAALAAASPYLLWRRLRHPAEMRERWAGGAPWRDHGAVWWHAASVGELEALRPVLELIRGERPELRHAVTLLTPTGRARARSMWDEAIEVRMLPLDWRPVVKRHLERLAPRALILVETEIWPAMLAGVHDRSIPAAIINGRISQRTFGRYKALYSFFKPLLAGLTCVGARTAADADAFTSLGVPRERIRVTGNTKYALPPRVADPVAWIKTGDWDAILVLGSVRSEELPALSQALAVLQRDLPPELRTLVVLAPRHLERAGIFASAARQAGFPVVLRSNLAGPMEPAGGKTHCAVILDTLGELADLWWTASAGMVGGTLAPIGGHNLYEPISRSCPIVFGPSTETVADVAEALQGGGGGRRVASGEELGRALVELASLRPLRREAAERARRTAEELAGGARRTVEWLRECGVLRAESGGR